MSTSVAGDSPPPVVAVVGATATGKSDLAIALARRLGGEVINADASQFYQGMDIGTAKVPLAERQGVPHHQLDVLDVREEATVATYQRAAREDLAAIRSRGAVPVVVGGSGLYVRALLDDLEIPPTDAAVRAHWEQRLADDGIGTLVAILEDRDPVAAAAIDPGNGRRIVRALEVIDLTGRPFSATMPTRTVREPTVLIGLRADRSVLHERVERRVHRMWDEGLVQEVRALEATGLRQGRTASRAIGYRQVLDLLDGVHDEARAIETTIHATRRLVRRQESWYGADPRITWLDATADAGTQLSRALRVPAHGSLTGGDVASTMPESATGHTPTT